ncbi:MAG TPA: hypothetical protein VF679_05165 [Pedobacter sp.]
MKESNSTQPKTDVRPKSMPQNHSKAKKMQDCSLKRTNEGIENSYHALKDYVIKLYKTLPNESDRIIVERDRSKEPMNQMGMYAFLTPHFYLYIECDFMLRYKVEYQLASCPFEKEILKELKETILRSHITEVMKMPNFPVFFSEVLKYQKEFTRIL